MLGKKSVTLFLSDAFPFEANKCSFGGKENLPAFSVVYIENYHRRSQNLNGVLYSKKATNLKYTLNCSVLGGEEK